jgi:hypothetical protein
MKNKMLSLLVLLALFGITATAAEAHPWYHGGYRCYGGGYYGYYHHHYHPYWYNYGWNGCSGVYINF